MRSNTKQVKQVWVRIHPPIHTKRPFTLFSFTLSDSSDTSKMHCHSSETSHLPNKLAYHTKTLLLPSLRRPKALSLKQNLVTESLKITIQTSWILRNLNAPGGEHARKLKQTLATTLYPSKNSQEKLKTICQRRENMKQKSQNRISFEL